MELYYYTIRHMPVSISRSLDLCPYNALGVWEGFHTSFSLLLAKVGQKHWKVKILG